MRTPAQQFVPIAIAAALVGLVPAFSTGASSQQGDRLIRSDDSWARSFGGIQSFSKPSRDAVMGFSVPTRVTEHSVIGGQRVKAGDLLVRGQDAEQLAIVKQTRMRAETDAAIRRAEKQSELAGIEYGRAKDAFDKDAMALNEVERYRVTWEVAEIDLEIAKMNAQLELIRLEQAEALLARYRIIAPFDGQIDQVFVGVGRSVGDTEPVVRVVQIDPVWIDVRAPTKQTIGLQTGTDAWVLVDGPEKPVVVKGAIIEVSPVADFASGSRRIRVEFANPDAWPPGMRTWVRFSEPTAEWLDRLAQGDQE